MSGQVLESLHDVVSAEHPTYIGGGTDIMPLLKNEVRDDKDFVFLKKIPELHVLEEKDGELIIGASDTVTKTYLLSRLEAFHRDYPDIRIRILNGTSHMVLNYLHAGQVDIAFASTPSDTSSLLLYPCFDTHAIFVAGAGYPCDFDHTYTLEEIAAFPLILLERKASSRLYLERFFLQNGLKLTPEIELGARSLLVDLAAIGFGVAGVTEEFVTRDLENGRLRQLKTSFHIPPRSVDMCMLRDVPQTAAAERFAAFVKQSLSKR